MSKIDRNDTPPKDSKITSKMVPKPSIFEPSERAAHPKMSKIAPKMCFFETANFARKNEPKNNEKSDPATTTYGPLEIDNEPPLPQTPSPRA